MCKHTKHPTYYHVVDEDNGEHIATYTNEWHAYHRSADEAMVNGRDFCTVVTG